MHLTNIYFDTYGYEWYHIINRDGKEEVMMKQKFNLRRECAKTLVLLIGLAIAHLGVTLFLLSNLGSDPYNVFVQGVFRTLQRSFGLPFLTHGYTHIIISFLVILILLLTDRSYIKLGTVLCMVFGGPIIDFYTYLFGDLIHDGLSVVLRGGISVVGCVVLAYGMTIVIKSEAGTGPNDLIAIVISDKVRKKFSLIRILVDITFVGGGYLLGGVFGIGTLFCAFLVGPVAGIFLPVNERMIKSIYGCIMSEKRKVRSIENKD